MFIKEAKVRVIRNSRKELSVEVELRTYKGTFKCSAPSGKSKGTHEVQDYHVRGVRYSAKLLEKFLLRYHEKNLMIKEFDDLVNLEEELKEFERENEILGGNCFYAIEGAILKAAAAEKNIPLWKFINGKNEKKMPRVIGNAIGGGVHTRVKHKKPDYQEFLFISREGENISRSITKNILAYYDAQMRIRIRERKLDIKKNDEGAIITSLKNHEVLEIMRNVARMHKLDIGIDVAASSFFDEKRQFYNYQNKRFLRTKEEQVEYLSILIDEFDLFYVEDPIHEEDFVSFRQLVEFIKRTKKNTLLVGDDLTTTNLSRLRRAHRNESINAIIIKPNQIGSLVEVKKVMQFCKQNNIKTIFSHRSGETEDNILADYTVGFGADFIKTGILGKERLVKLARLVRINAEN